MSTITICAIGISYPNIKALAAEAGYEWRAAATFEDAEACVPQSELILCDATLLAENSRETFMQCSILNTNSLPLAFCIAPDSLLAPNDAHGIKSAGYEVLYFSELASGLFWYHLERMVLYRKVSQNIVYLQEHLRERDSLRKELFIKDKIVDHERELNANIIDSIGSGLVFLDTTGMVILMNDFARKILRLVDADCIGVNLAALLAPDLWTGVERYLNNVKTQEQTHEIHKCKFEESYLQFSGFKMRDRKDIMTGLILIIQDVTEQENTTVHLYRTEKLATIGTMLSGIAHELRNPLAIISARVQRTLAKDLTDIDTTRKAFESIEKQTERCSVIVNNLLDFTRHKAAAVESHRLAELLDETLTYVDYQNIFDNISVIKEYGKDLTVWGDRSRYAQVILNLITNAADAMQGRGTLTIGSAPYGGKHVLVQISDTGPGIPLDIQNRVFDPFFTTKDPGKGTGLGLAICHKIIQESGGQIWFRSRPGATAFFIKFPTVKDSTL